MLFSLSVDFDFIFDKNAAQFQKQVLFFLTMISLLNCPPLPDSVPVELH